VFRFLILALIALAIVPTSMLRPHEPGRLPERPFCDRNPHTCGAASELWDGLVIKSSLVLEMALRNVNGDDGESSSQPTRLGVTPSATESDGATGPVQQVLIPALRSAVRDTLVKGTLMPEDRAPAWRQPTRTE